MAAVLSRMALPTSDGESSLSSVLCRPTASVNCDYVLGSAYAKIGPVPSAFAGMFYFAFLLLWFAVVGIPNRAGRAWHWIPLGLTALGMAASIWFTYVMAVRLPVWCPLCGIFHAINACVFALTCLAWRRLRSVDRRVYAAAGSAAAASDSGASYPSAARAGVTAGAALAAGVILLLGAYALTHQINSIRYHRELLRIKNDVDYIVWRHGREPRREIGVGPADLVLGDPNATNTLVVFSDFECHACAGFHKNAAGLVRTFPQVRCVFKHFPMSRECNPGVPKSMHVFACDAARAAAAFNRLVEAQEKREQFYTALYRQRERLAERPYARLVLEVMGASTFNPRNYEERLKSAEVLGRVQADIELARVLGVEGTPTIFLNGRRLESWGIRKTERGSEPDAEKTAALWKSLLNPNANQNGVD